MRVKKNPITGLDRPYGFQEVEAYTCYMVTGRFNLLALEFYI
jgi:hypothetical protein